MSERNPPVQIIYQTVHMSGSNPPVQIINQIAQMLESNPPQVIDQIAQKLESNPPVHVIVQTAHMFGKQFTSTSYSPDCADVLKQSISTSY